MKIFISFLLLPISVNSFAQKKGNTIITRDTINLHGYVFNYDGTPHADVSIYSKQKDTIYNLTNMGTLTDARGYFKINGARFNDTLSVGPLTVYNKGSRHIVVYMQSAPQKMDAQIEITARRIHSKSPAKFVVKSYVQSNKDYPIYDIEPAYPGGLTRFKQDILNKLAYPQKAIDNNIEGTIEIGFTILRDGRVNNYKVLKGLGYGCEDEVIQIMKSLPKWQPDIQNGRPVEQNYTIEILFKLTDN